MVGAEDDLLKDNPLTGYEQEADDMTIERIPGVGHWMLDEAPEAVLPRMLDFFGERR